MVILIVLGLFHIVNKGQTLKGKAVSYKRSMPFTERNIYKSFSPPIEVCWCVGSI